MINYFLKSIQKFIIILTNNCNLCSLESLSNVNYVQLEFKHTYKLQYGYTKVVTLTMLDAKKLYLTAKI